MPQPAKNASAPDSTIEYSIHVFENKNSSGQSQGISNDMQKTLADADRLVATGKYVRVDVRQKYFDKKTNRVVDGVLKSLTHKKKNPMIPLFLMMFLAILAGGGAFALAYFLTRS
jgi:hypothetical protein